MFDTSGKVANNIWTLLAALSYMAFFWRVFKSNPGNRLVECGTTTLIMFMAMLSLTSYRDIPDWLFGSWLVLMLLLCFSTLFFVVQRAYRAFRH